MDNLVVRKKEIRFYRCLERQRGTFTSFVHESTLIRTTRVRAAFSLLAEEFRTSSCKLFAKSRHARRILGPRTRLYPPGTYTVTGCQNNTVTKSLHLVSFFFPYFYTLEYDVVVNRYMLRNVHSVFLFLYYTAKRANILYRRI